MDIHWRTLLSAQLLLMKCSCAKDTPPLSIFHPAEMTLQHVMRRSRWGSSLARDLAHVDAGGPSHGARWPRVLRLAGWPTSGAQRDRGILGVGAPGGDY